jgi:hypothetical protein
MRGDTRKPPTWRQWIEQHGRWRAAVLSSAWLSEQIIHRSHGWDLANTLNTAGKLTIIFAVGWWLLESGDRAKAKHYQAWGLIYTARGSSEDGGRQNALRDLFGDGVSLAGAPLSGANLVRLELPEADLYKADLSGADLFGADLSGANLFGANLSGVSLIIADLSEADLRAANLSGSYISGANLLSANLSAASLFGANLSGANLTKANLTNAILTQADLTGAIFCNTTMPDGSGNNTGCPSEPSNSRARSGIPPTAPASPAPQSRSLGPS